MTDLLTVNATRVSRGYETILELPRQASQINGGIDSSAQIHICPQKQESFLLKAVQDFGGSDPDATQKRIQHIREKARKQLQYKSVSLSWWLSPPLQAFLDGQVYSSYNQKKRDCVISLLEDNAAASRELCR